MKSTFLYLANLLKDYRYTHQTICFYHDEVCRGRNTIEYYLYSPKQINVWENFTVDGGKMAKLTNRLLRVYHDRGIGIFE